ncbi:MAG: FAD:protein FMN transferase [Phycisphaerales bacterium]|nr:FAD:protein FMN transferase [Phycisphaerales bacterium]
MIVRLATHAMRTRFELVLAGEDEVHLRAVGEAAIDEIQECDRRLSLFRTDSLLSHINAHAASEWVRLDEDTFELFSTCQRVHAESGSAFDVTVAPLMQAWGFHGERGDTTAAREAVGMEAVLLDNDRCAIRFARDDIRIDMGAVGKGHALDLAGTVLRDHTVTCALLHGGTSTILAIGAPPGESGWRASVGRDDGGPVAVLRDEALSVSGSHGRVIETDGKRIGHVLDPRNGEPADGAALAAVIAPSAGLADAWSTALLVLADAQPAAHVGLTAIVTSGSRPPDSRLAAGPRRDQFEFQTTLAATRNKETA